MMFPSPAKKLLTRFEQPSLVEGVLPMAGGGWN